MAISGSCYYFENTTTLNYTNAKLNCQNKFGNLVGQLFEPRLANTNQLVSSAAANFVPGFIKDFWLGINDLATQGQYVYASDGDSVGSGMWYSGQPNFGNERCASYYKIPTYGGEWFDRPCNFERFSICEPGTYLVKQNSNLNHQNTGLCKYMLTRVEMVNKDFDREKKNK